MKNAASGNEFWFASAFILILTLGLIQGWFFKPSSDAPLSGNILLVVFINLNVLLLLLLAYLVLRNFVKLIFERKRNILGSKLKTRLVASSVALTLIPAVPLFWFASHFIFSSLDHWFSSKVEISLANAVQLAKDYVEREKTSLISECRALLPEAVRIMTQEKEKGQFDPGIAFLYASRIDAAYVFSPSGDLRWSFRQNAAQEIDTAFLVRSFRKEGGTASKFISFPERDSERHSCEHPAAAFDW